MYTENVERRQTVQSFVGRTFDEVFVVHNHYFEELRVCFHSKTVSVRFSRKKATLNNYLLAVHVNVPKMDYLSCNANSRFVVRNIDS